MLKSPMWTNYVQAAHTGSGQPQLNATIMKDFEFPLPPLDEQHRIAWILGSLDDKIDSNRRLAKSLEDAATALFKANFTDLIGQEDLIMTEARQIPRGWALVPIAELAQYVNGKAFTKFGNGRGRPVIRIAELRSGFGHSTVYTDHVTEPEFLAQPGDILFAWSGSLGVYRWYRDEALINQHIFKVIPSGYPAWFVFFALKYVMPRFRSIAADKATTMGHIKRAHLSEYAIAVPPSELLAKHDAEFSPLFDRALQAWVEIETLKQIRDQLLPRLLTGQIRASRDAEFAS